MLALHSLKDLDWLLQCAEKLREIQDYVSKSSLNEKLIYHNYYVFKMMVKDNRISRQALEHSQAVYEIYSVISPFSQATRIYELIFRKIESIVAALEYQ